MKYTNLRKKTIFDITSDSDILNQIVSPEDKDFFIKNITDSGRATTFFELAELTNDKDLEKAVLEEFKEELNEDE